MITVNTPSPIRTDSPLLHWSSTERIFAAEASTLEANGITPGRVYNDACDIGYTLVSHLTGSRRVMVEDHRERDSEGDLLWSDYVPVQELAGLVRGREPSFTLRVYND